MKSNLMHYGLKHFAPLSQIQSSDNVLPLQHNTQSQHSDRLVVEKIIRDKQKLTTEHNIVFGPSNLE